MRTAVKTFDWHLYGLSIQDFDYTVDIVKRIIDSRGDAVTGRGELIAVRSEGRSAG